MGPQNNTFNFAVNLAKENAGSKTVTWDLNVHPAASWIDFGYTNSDYSSITTNTLANVTEYWSLEIEGLDIGGASIYDDAQVAIISSATSLIYISKTAYQGFIPYMEAQGFVCTDTKTGEMLDYCTSNKTCSSVYQSL